MKKIFLYMIGILAFVAGGCDVIPENERIVEMDEVIPLKKVLLVDFTDQDCINCLQAAAEIEKLKEDYGENVITVSVHASTRRFPLRTAEGNEYQEHFLGQEPVPHPNGVIDGIKKTTNFALWSGMLRERFNETESAKINLSGVYQADKHELTIKSDIKVLKTVKNAKLLLWIIEDDVIDFQLVSAGVYDYEYHHKHVFRSSINGTWGEDLSLEYGQEKQIEHSYTLKEDWKTENISVIAFVYNPDTDEVSDVMEFQIINK